MSASVFTLPILAMHFGEVSLLSIPASLALSPLVAVAVPAIIATAVMEPLGLPGAGLIAAGADGLLIVTSAFAERLSLFPWATVHVTAGEAASLVLGLAIAVVAARAPWRLRGRVRVVSAVMLSSACFVAASWMNCANSSLFAPLDF